jgi:hypothetical protein
MLLLPPPPCHDNARLIRAGLEKFARRHFHLCFGRDL